MGTAILLASENLSIFDPVSPPAASIRNLAVIVFAIAGLIFLVVEIVLLYSIVRFRRRPPAAATPHPLPLSPKERGEAVRDRQPPQVYGSYAIEIAWTAAPALIVFVLMLVVVRTEWEVRPVMPSPAPGDNTLYVTVIGRQWWWEYRYTSYDGKPLSFVTANELVIPACDASPRGVQRPVRLTLESADVCHSFWVPRLAGKTDLIPRRTNHMWFQTAQRGLFLGQCAEYCGTQHAKMLLRVQVVDPAEFERWLIEQARIADPDRAAVAGRELFLRQSCVNCHRVAGTTAVGTYGPDLTHLMSRQTLAAGIMPNNAANLRQWVIDPHKIKPGCLMPAFGLSEGDVDKIVAYLLTLK